MGELDTADPAMRQLRDTWGAASGAAPSLTLTACLPANSSWMQAQATPETTADARQHAKSALSAILPEMEPARVRDYLDAVQTVVSEVVTNAVAAARDIGVPAEDVYPDPIRLGLDVGHRYVHAVCVDPDIHGKPLPTDGDGPPLTADGEIDIASLAVGGRGLLIVEAIAAAWWVECDGDSKAVHVIVPAPGVTLTAGELARLRR